MTRQPAAVRTRVVVAAALLATVGLGCVFAVMLLTLLLGLLSSEGPQDVELGSLARFALALVLIPAIAWLMLAAAVTIHGRRSLGRWLALLVALLLALSPIASIVLGAVPDSTIGSLLLLHLFLLPGPVSWLPLVHVAFGSFIAWSVITGRPRRPAEPSRLAADLVGGWYLVRRPRSISRLAAVLGLIGVDALLPVVVRLAAVAAPDEGGFAGMGAVRTGVLVLDSVLISGLVLLAAHALATRRRIALLITLPAAAIGIVWASLWGLVLVAGLLPATGDDSGSSLGLLLLLAILGLLLGLAVSALVVTVRHRAWFEPVPTEPGVETGQRRRPSGRQWLAATAVAEVGVVVSVALAPGPPAGDEAAVWLRPDEVPQEVMVDGRYFDRVGWASMPSDELDPIDEIDIEQPLAAPEQQPRGYSLAGVPAAQIVAVEPGSAPPAATSRHVALYTAEDDPSGEPDLPASLCPLVDLPTVERGRCAAPERLVYADHWYQRDVAFRVPADRLTPTGVDARFDTTPGTHVPTEVDLVVGVDPTVAVALRTPTGGLVYRVDAPIPELCEFLRDAREISSDCPDPGDGDVPAARLRI